MKGSLHTDELLGAVVAKETGLRTAPPDQPRLHHGRCRPTRSRCSSPMPRSTSRPTSRPRSTSSRTRSTWRCGLGVGCPGWPSSRRSRRSTPRSRPRSRPRRCARWPTAARSPAALIDGPLALDNAISAVAAQVKGIKSPVAGRANILLVPDLEAGNMLAKNLSFLANADAAGIVLGARVPIILTSRADSVRTRLASCAVAALYAHAAARRPPRRGGVGPMGGTILVVNAGSSSIKFQLFERLAADRLELQLKGQIEGIGTRPRLLAKDADRPVLADDGYAPDQVAGRARGAGPARRLAGGPAGRGEAGGHRPPRRAWRAEVQRAGADRRRGPGRARDPGAAGAAASAQQSGADPGHPRALPGDAAGGLLRHRLPPPPPRGRRSLRDPGRATTRRACAATASTACPTSTSRTV